MNEILYCIHQATQDIDIRLILEKAMGYWKRRKLNYIPDEDLLQLKSRYRNRYRPRVILHIDEFKAYRFYLGSAFDWEKDEEINTWVMGFEHGRWKERDEVAFIDHDEWGDEQYEHIFTHRVQWLPSYGEGDDGYFRELYSSWNHREGTETIIAAYIGKKSDFSMKRNRIGERVFSYSS